MCGFFMMPSACKNSDKLSVAEMEPPFKACISAIEKKARNLEKRKAKLDSYREKLANGEKLDKDQKEAVDKYDSVVSNLEFARELQKQFQSMSDEADKQAEKATKKQAKKEKLERQQQELERLSDVLRLQCLLENLGTEEIRTDLCAGKYGSMTFSEDNLTQLDEFYQVIAPSVDGEKTFCSRLASASEHLVSYLDRSDKQVVGTTYKDVHQLVDQVAESGFFDVVGRESAEPEAVASVTDPASAETDQPAEPESAPAGDDMTGNGESSIAVLSKSDISDAPFEVVSDSGPTLPTSDSQLPSSVSVSWYQSSSSATSLGAPAGNQVRPQRPLQEIVSSMQGSYNFLQDSEIDVDQSFERMGFGVSQSHDSSGYTYMPQQMSTQSAVNVSQYSTADPTAAYPNSRYASTHHHQVALQEPSFVVVGHDLTSGEVHHYTYPAGQSAYLPQVMTSSSDMPAQQTSAAGPPSQPAACMPSAATLGAGDSAGMIPPEKLLPSSQHTVPDPRHQGGGYDSSAVHNYTQTGAGYNNQAVNHGAGAYVSYSGSLEPSRGGGYSEMTSAGGSEMAVARGGRPR